VEDEMPVAYEITLKDHHVERIHGADAYAQEGQLTTFFRTDPERRIVDRWSVRLASFRTSEVVAVRRLEHADAGRPSSHQDGPDGSDRAEEPTPLRRVG
jgi:hypothetical protein